MKTLSIITIAAFIFPTLVFSKSNDKFYQITDNGKFQYSYWMETGNDNAKAGGKPVTLRTFFLETAKNGLLPLAMTYGEFTKLSIEEKQSILSNSQFAIIAAIERTEEIVPDTRTATEAMMSPVKEVNVTEQTLEEGPATNRVTIDLNTPWIVKAVTIPGTEDNLPARNIFEMKIEDNELSWATDMIINDGSLIDAKYAKAVKTSKNLNANK